MRGVVTSTLDKKRFAIESQRGFNFYLCWTVCIFGWLVVVTCFPFQLRSTLSAVTLHELSQNSEIKPMVAMLKLQHIVRLITKLKAENELQA